jgi:putative transposase
MGRMARVVVPGQPHHVTQRGNNRQLIFDSDNDRKKYLLWLTEYSAKFSLTVVAYCLMDNHIHFVVVPRDKNSLARIFHAVHMRYAQYFNKKMGRAGHLWQGRFYSCFLDPVHLVAAVRYVERNPVRKRIIRHPWDWRWSSAAEHTGRAKSFIKLDNFRQYLDISFNAWEKFIGHDEKPELLDNIRRHTHTGKSMETGVFIEEYKKIIKTKNDLLLRPDGRNN